MKKINNRTRRVFLKNAAATSLITAVGSVETIASAETQDNDRNDYGFDKVFNRIGVNSMKWDGAIEKYGKDKIKVPMTIADMDFKQMPAVTQALMERLQYEGFGYETPSDEFYQSIIDWQRNQHKLILKKEWIRNSPGVTDAIGPALRALNPTGGKVLVMTPTYSGFMHEIERVRMGIEMSPMKNISGRWEMDLVDLEKRIDSNTKCLILCNPNNPTGECWTVNELRKLGDVCIRNGITVFSDEIWADVVRAGKKYTPYASIGEKYANSSITFTSSAKVFNQPMLKVSYFYSKNVDLINAVMQNGGHHDEVNTFGIVATETAYRKGEDWMNKMNKYVEENFVYLESFVNELGELPGVTFSKPESTYFAWLECSELMQKIIQNESQTRNKDISNPENLMSDWLIENAGVQLDPGINYGIGGEGYLRMNIAVSREHLTLALNNLSRAAKMLIW
ncbi:MAG: aminotransferase class I/II-fold pyridoxal phosphate-dependent enzyme [Kordiimonadaceae bacterium]|jgi:cysteine-S-conjugate beta-lyase|nr:aminotransferase class I/II-fold pyridoxal phosphate-dependent enzyme [Kordiimonadaceae bacterium]MBT6031339.1 aminotransferase class I/II-fold pyridoxal phosphate-dependent enzyme [Kordiimonadaceae bacterium]